MIMNSRTRRIDTIKPTIGAIPNATKAIRIKAGSRYQQFLTGD